MELSRILYGAVIGAGYSLLNWSRKRADRRREDVKRFRDISVRRMIVHIVAGAIAGGAIAMSGREVSPSEIQNVIATAGLVPIVENVGMIVVYIIDQYVHNIVPERKERSLWG